MESEDHVSNIESNEGKIKKLRLLIALLNKADFSDKELMKEGNNEKYLIYNFKDQKFEFVSHEKSKKEENSVPYKHLMDGKRGCLKFWDDNIRHLESAITLSRTKL